MYAERRKLDALANILGVGSFGRDEDALRKAYSIVRGLGLDYAHLEGEVRHRLSTPESATDSYLRKLRQAKEEADEWVRGTKTFGRVLGRKKKGEPSYVPMISSDRVVAVALRDCLGDALERIERSTGGPRGYSSKF